MGDRRIEYRQGSVVSFLRDSRVDYRMEIDVSCMGYRRVEYRQVNDVAYIGDRRGFPYRLFGGNVKERISL
jgi:hypothetical protein